MTHPIVKRNIRNRLKYIIWNSDLEATHFSLAVGSLLWALLLLYPGDLFTQGRTTYLVMAQIAPEEVWGMLFLLQGVVMLVTLLWGYKTRITYLTDAVLGCVLWTASTAACFISHYVYGSGEYQPPAAMSYEIVAALASWWCLVRYKFLKATHG